MYNKIHKFLLLIPLSWLTNWTVIPVHSAFQNLPCGLRQNIAMIWCTPHVQWQMRSPRLAAPEEPHSKSLGINFSTKPGNVEFSDMWPRIILASAIPKPESGFTVFRLQQADFQRDYCIVKWCSTLLHRGGIAKNFSRSGDNFILRTEMKSSREDMYCWR